MQHNAKYALTTFLAIYVPFPGENALTPPFCGIRRLVISRKLIMREFLTKPLLHFEKGGVC
ncbi:hypothetical protein X745_32050 [Mesorhizobium sp. LNJC374B00]|nr:hypothetical protein X745_32050 [Mesorhizobium sp. LNJC374B00]